MDIIYLADKPELVPTLAKWTYDTWSLYDNQLTFEMCVESVKSKLNHDKMPLALVMMDGNTPIGMASLKTKIKLGGYEEKSPWLGSLFVHQSYRDKAVGIMLLDAIYKKAKELGFSEIFVFASDPDAAKWYFKQGWELFARDMFRSHEVQLLTIKL